MPACTPDCGGSPSPRLPMPARTACCVLWAALFATCPSAASDWPNFRGPYHDGISREQGVVPSWTASGPTILWRCEIGAGFSTFAIAEGRLYTCGQEDERQVLFCLDVTTGKVLWKRDFEPQYTDPDAHLYGTRATPTFDEGRVYIMGAHAHVICFDARTGDELWKQAFTHKPNWGYSGSVLIQDDLAIVAAGGSEGSLRALDKKTGELAWTCGDDPAGYATPYPFSFEGSGYVFGFMAHSFIIAHLRSGKLALRVEWPSHSGVTASSPIFHDGHLFVSSGYGYGSALFKLQRDGEQLTAKEVWRNLKIRSKFQTPLLLDGKLYASDENGFKCVDFMTGRRHWRKRGVRHGTLVAGDGHLFVFTETGELQIAKASPDGFEPLQTAKLFGGTSYSLFQRLARQQQGERCWTVPVLCGGKLFARNHDTVICIDLRAGSSAAAAANEENPTNAPQPVPPTR